MIEAVMTMIFGPIEPKPPIDDPLLAAAASVVSTLPHLSDRHGRLTTSGRFAVARIVYMAEMIHVGEHGIGFLRELPEATTYGPLHPELFEATRWSFRMKPSRYVPLREDAQRCVDQACDLMGLMTSGEIVSITHWEGGAWARRYVPGRRTERGPVIHIEDLADEYVARQIASRKQAA